MAPRVYGNAILEYSYSKKNIKKKLRPQHTSCGDDVRKALVNNMTSL